MAAWDQLEVAERANRLVITRDEEEDDDIGDDWMPPNFNPGKRRSVYAEGLNLQDPIATVVHEKSVEQYAMLKIVVQKIFLFQKLEPHEVKLVIDAMFRREVSRNEIVILQGDDGDNFYVVESGVYDVFVNDKNVASYNDTGYFGELALMYNCPRAATIKCRYAGVLWALDRVVFRQVLMKHAQEKTSLYESFIKKVPVLEYLSLDERHRLVDALELAVFREGDRILKQGDPADAFYFVISGSVKVTVTRKTPDGNNEEIKVNELHAGSYFGELALLTKRPRAANIYAQGSVTCARLSVDSFERLLGPCLVAMKGNIPGYEVQLAGALGKQEGRTHLGLKSE